LCQAFFPSVYSRSICASHIERGRIWRPGIGGFLLAPFLPFFSPCVVFFSLTAFSLARLFDLPPPRRLRHFSLEVVGPFRSKIRHTCHPPASSPPVTRDRFLFALLANNRRLFFCLFDSQLHIESTELSGPNLVWSRYRIT